MPSRDSDVCIGIPSGDFSRGSTLDDHPSCIPSLPPCVWAPLDVHVCHGTPPPDDSFPDFFIPLGTRHSWSTLRTMSTRPFRTLQVRRKGFAGPGGTDLGDAKGNFTNQRTLSRTPLWQVSTRTTRPTRSGTVSPTHPREQDTETRGSLE